MKRFFEKRKVLLSYLIVFSVFLAIPLLGNYNISAFSQNLSKQRCVIIDAGHGGEDGGAVSCTGVYESNINLQVAQKLEDLFHLLGYKTRMIRDSDRSIYTEGTTIAAKKVSDIKERVRIVNTTPYALCLSIHQNYYQDPRYSGAQVFYNTSSDSKLLAERIQTAFREHLDANNKRQCKKISGVYLMDHINCTGVLVECGFLSNPEEEKNLRNDGYQRKLCTVIASAVSQYLNT